VRKWLIFPNPVTYFDDLRLYYKSEADMLALVNTFWISSENIQMNF